MVGASEGQAKGTQPTEAIRTLGWQYSLDFSASTTIPPFKGCFWADPGSPSVETHINQHSKNDNTLNCTILRNEVSDT